jgi:cysteine desulfurase
LRVIYLDSNATSRIDPRVLEVMLPYLTDHFANPSSSYTPARAVRAAMETARAQVATLIRADPSEMHFTSGGTEALNAVLESTATAFPNSRLIIGATEHPAVSEPAKRWIARGGQVSIAPVDPHGITDLPALHRLLQSGDVSLVAIMWANNETGVISPMAEIVQAAHTVGARVLCDAVQAVGKVPLSVRAIPVDYLALSGHKFHAPKGSGALYISRRARFDPWLLGGGQEAGRRSGTENVAGISGLGAAAVLMDEALATGSEAAISTLRDNFENTVLSACPRASVNGSLLQRLPTTTSITFDGLVAAEMLILLDQVGIYCSAGSACHSAAVHPSPTLAAMGLSATAAASTLRFSFSRFTTCDEVASAALEVIRIEQKLRQLADESSGPVVQS